MTAFRRLPTLLLAHVLLLAPALFPLQAQAGDVGAKAAIPICPRATRMDKAALEAEAVCLLQRYVRIDTTNPPGHEAATVDFLADYLAGEGIESTRYESAPGRVNLLARLKGDGSRKALMLVHHMDVVPANPAEWSVPPFAGDVRDGYLWGRGSLDDKGPGIMQLLSFVMLKRLHVPLSRDVVLLAVGDEEQGGGQGARFMVAEHFNALQDVEFALNEGGAMLELPGKHSLYAVEFAQKVPLWLKLVASGPAGHASNPKPESATHRLVRALSRLEQFRFPLIVVPAVQQVFDHRALAMAPGQRERYQHLAQSLEDPAFRAEFLKDPRNVTMVSNSLAITMMAGSSKENVLPAQATAVLDLRLLPGQVPAEVIAKLKDVMQEPEVQVETLLSSTAHASPLDTALYQAIAAQVRQEDPGAAISPSFIAGFTDCNTFRAKGITCYGYLPMRLPMEETERVHGRDERINVADFVQGIARLHALAVAVAGTAPP